MSSLFPKVIPRKWDEAAALIIAARHAAVPKPKSESVRSDYGVLLMQRGGSAPFAENFHVFPGGLLDKSDTCSEWTERFARVLRTGTDRDKTLGILSSTACCNKIRAPPTFTRRRQADERIGPFSLPAEVAFKICSIRETFEESGILLAQREDNADYGEKVLDIWPYSRALTAQSLPMSSSDRDYWTERVRGDASEFLNMCRALNCVPDVWSVHLWQSWLTSSNWPKRFDTAFFLTVLPEIPQLYVNNAEHTNVTWQDPTTAVEAMAGSKVNLPPPQAMEMLRLANYRSSDELLQFSSRRAQEHGGERWCPTRIKCSDGSLGLFPGDSQYGNFSSGDIEVDCTAMEFLSRSRNVHALVINGPKDYRFFCNIPERRGHRFPKSYAPCPIPDIDAVAWLQGHKLVWCHHTKCSLWEAVGFVAHWQVHTCRH